MPERPSASLLCGKSRHPAPKNGVRLATTSHLLPEHNTACERARLSRCNCYCHGAGHQHDLIMRAVSCTTNGTNELAQLLIDLGDIYGGFHTNFRDGTTEARRKIPEDLATLELKRGRRATWVETLLVDEALHAAFVQVARLSISLTDAERERRKAFVIELAEGALRIVGGDVESHNICDGHLWCSILAEANDSTSQASSAPIAQAARYGRICYPRNRNARIPRGLADSRASGVAHVNDVLGGSSAVVGLEDIVHLAGAVTCPDLWHHPAGVRYSLQPFVTGAGWPKASTTTLARKPGSTISRADGPSEATGSPLLPIRCEELVECCQQPVARPGSAIFTQRVVDLVDFGSCVSRIAGGLRPGHRNFLRRADPALSA